MKMNKRQFKYIWFTFQLALFILPILGSLWYVPYSISYDEKYVSDVNERAFQQAQEGKITDFKDATVAEKDAEGNYVYKEWKLQNKELYWIYAVIFGIVIGSLFQMFNVIWKFCYQEKYDDDEGYY